MKIKVTVGLSRCQQTIDIEVTDDASDEEIDRVAVEAALASIIQISWERVP